MPDTFAITIIFIIIVTVIAAFVRGRSRDKCMKDFSMLISSDYPATSLAKVQVSISSGGYSYWNYILEISVSLKENESGESYNRVEEVLPARTEERQSKFDEITKNVSDLFKK